VLVRYALAAGAAAVLGAAVFATPAAAHIAVSPGEAVQGEFTRLAFRVPNESDEANTTKVEVFLPEDAPVASASTMPVPGWTVVVQRRTLPQPIEVHGAQVSEVVASLTWTAAPGAGVKPGEFQEFAVSLGPLPDVDTMVFKALQTYSDGNVVRWIELPEPGAEPEHPAPVLKLVPAAAAATTPTASAGSGDGGGSAGLWLGVAGLVAGLGGLALGGLAYARTRRTAT
jgi:uncharacterized protein YcnI